MHLAKHHQLSSLSTGHVVEQVHDRPTLLWSQAMVTLVVRRDGWALPPGPLAWVPAWTRFAVYAPPAATVDALFLHPVRARRVSRPTTILHVDALLQALVDRVVSAPLAADEPADRRLFAVLIDRLALAPSLPLLVRAPRHPSLTAAAEAVAPSANLAPSVPALAAAMRASRRTVERTFAREVGLTVGRWRQQVRLTRAVALLAEGRRVGDVAHEVGYRTPSAFVAAFKKAMGMTPKRFVRQRPGT